MLLKRRTYNHRGGAGPSNTPSVDNDSNASGRKFYEAINE